MTGLERMALLGDVEVQKLCTERGIVLACPKCFKPVTVHGPDDWKPTFYDPDSGGEPYGFYCKCGLDFGTNDYEFKDALAKWNTRPAPPIWRCGACGAYADNKRMNTGYYKPETGFCDDFEPKGDEENDK